MKLTYIISLLHNGNMDCQVTKERIQNWIDFWQKKSRYWKESFVNWVIKIWLLKLAFQFFFIQKIFRILFFVINFEGREGFELGRLETYIKESRQSITETKFYIGLRQSFVQWTRLREISKFQIDCGTDNNNIQNKHSSSFELNTCWGNFE